MVEGKRWRFERRVAASGRGRLGESGRQGWLEMQALIDSQSSEGNGEQDWLVNPFFLPRLTSKIPG